MNIGIIGGGLMGLATALHLSEMGHRITVFEKDDCLGGLANSYNYGSFVWDQYYHVILPSDLQLIHFLNHIGLAEKLVWQRTFTGFYKDNKFYSMSNAYEFLRFPLISYLEKARLAITILSCAHTRNWQQLEKIPIEDWLIKKCGQNAFEKLWRPLLMSKLGEDYQRVSALFIWTYIKRMFSARDSSVQKEHLGYVKGGYQTVFNRLEEILCSSGSVIHKNRLVDGIKPYSKAGIDIRSHQKWEHFDKVIYTLPMNQLKNIMAHELCDHEINELSMEYLGVICLVLVTYKPLVPYYVVNITDREVPFTGVIGLSSVVSTEETNGYYLTYFPKYLSADSYLFQENEDQLFSQFLKGVRIIFPDLKESDIQSMHINRSINVQPLQVINYSSFVPNIKTKYKDFFILNNSQIIEDTLNNNAVIKHSNSFIKFFDSFVS